MDNKEFGLKLEPFVKKKGITVRTLAGDETELSVRQL